MLDDNTVLGDTREGNVGVGNVLDSTSIAGNGLDANTVLAVGDGRRADDDVLDSIIRSSTNGADGETMSTTARTTSESDILRFDQHSL